MKSPDRGSGDWMSQPTMGSCPGTVGGVGALRFVSPLYGPGVLLVEEGPFCP